MLPEDKAYQKSQEVSPATIVWMLVLLNILLGLVVLLFPNQKRNFTFDSSPPFIHLLPDSLSEAEDAFSLQFVSATDLFIEKERIVVDVDSVLKGMESLDTATEEVVIVDTTYQEPELNRKIQFDTIKNHSLDAFFTALEKVEKGSDSIIRILHYGDSQLEGDRITDFLRNKLQNRFGGYGPGIVLPIDISRARRSIIQSESMDWEKYAIYTRNRLKDGAYGIGGSSYKYTGTYFKKIGEDTIVAPVYDSLITKMVKQKIALKKDSAKKKDSFAMVEIQVPFDSNAFVLDTTYKPIYEAQKAVTSWLRYRCATTSYPRVRSFSQVKLMYASKDTTTLTVKVDGIEKLMTLYPAPYGTIKAIWTGNVTNEVFLSFKGASPTIFGVSFDGERGVAVDNFPMRGSSGTGYSTINHSIYSRQLKATNTKLIIMQYGINVVPNPVKNYDFYKRMFAGELQAIKRANPGVSILVIGPSDMSRKVGGEYVSYPNITKIRDAMRTAAFENDCAFWDLFSAMGGENSMVGWVNNDPTLAAKDYTHFNSRGARYISEMLYNAIMSEYTLWRNSKDQL